MKFKPSGWASTVPLALLFGDALFLIFCFNAAHWIRLSEVIEGYVTWPMLWPVALVLFSLFIFDAYRPSVQTPLVRFIARAVVGTLVAGVLISLFVYFFGYWGKDLLYGRGIFSMALLLFTPGAAVMRYGAYGFENRRARKVRWLVLGANERAALLYSDHRGSNFAGNILFVPQDETERQNTVLPLTPFTLDGFVSDLARDFSVVVIAIQPPFSDDLVKKLMEARFNGARIYDLAGFYENVSFKVPVLHMRAGWFVFSDGFDLLHNPVGLRVKRVLDVMGAIALLLLFIPLFALVALLIRLDSKGSVIFRQSRRGENGVDFTVYKFRSMYDGAQQEGAWTFQNDPRITRFGRIMRLVRLDELPQLINVIRGDMSFIGPRPEAVELSSLYEQKIPFYQLRYLVKPGITGWAQVMYRYGSSVEDAREKLQYDLYYIKNYSLFLDLVILLKTLRVVLSGRGR